MFMPKTRRRAFTITELLVVIGVIIVLLGVLLTALTGVWSQGKMTGSMSNLKQIALWLRQYSTDNSEYIVPSQFDYAENPYPGKVRSVVNLGEQYRGTWTDILWTVFELNPFAEDSTGTLDYRFDSPDRELYDGVGGWAGNPLRSSAANTRQWPASMVANPGPKPFGDGAQETGYPGYFAANDFFDSTGEDDRWVTNAQIRFPAQSMYLVDSFVGEVIADEPVPFDDTKDPSTLEVDFRYGDMCLMLFLDGHVEAETVWMDLDELSKRRVRVTELTGPGT